MVILHHPWKWAGDDDGTPKDGSGSSGCAAFTVRSSGGWLGLRRAFTMAATMMLVGTDDGYVGEFVGVAVGGAKWVMMVLVARPL